jgi:DNA replication protein DnaC
MSFTKPPPDPEPLRGRARDLGLYGLVARWDEVRGEPWLERLFALEEAERQRRSLERRVRNARLGRFKAACDFDWAWPAKIDHELVDELLRLDFVREGSNVIFVGPHGVGKTTLAQNLAQQALVAGHTVRCTTAAEMLHDLGAADSSRALSSKLGKYVGPKLLVIDEVGYLSYDGRYADLLFEVVTRRYNLERSIVLTTNKAFGEWAQVFPNAACVVTLVDRLMHRAELVAIEGESYRLKEAKERTAKRAAKKRGTRA